MDIRLDQIQITNNTAESRFETTIDGVHSKLDYVLDHGTIVITHVGVHPQLRGHGVAARLTQAGLEYARANSLRVVPMCSYVVAYIRRNPSYAALVRPASGA